MTEPTTVHIVSLGCARNDVDSDELAGRLEAGGFRLVDEPAEAEAIVVNTCGFVESAKKDSIDTLLAASDLKGNGRTQRVVAVGCMAERYGRELADALPAAERYTSIVDGNGQPLQQAFGSPSLLAAQPAYDIVHVNAEFAARVSDQDPIWASFTLPAPTLATPRAYLAYIGR